MDQKLIVLPVEPPLMAKNVQVNNKRGRKLGESLSPTKSSLKLTEVSKKFNQTFGGDTLTNVH
jgi:hypothetical protein